MPWVAAFLLDSTATGGRFHFAILPQCHGHIESSFRRSLKGRFRGGQRMENELRFLSEAAYLRSNSKEAWRPSMGIIL